MYTEQSKAQKLLDQIIEKIAHSEIMPSKVRLEIFEKIALKRYFNRQSTNRQEK